MTIRDLREADVEAAISVIRNMTALAGVPRLFEDMLTGIYSLVVTTGDTVIDVGAHRGMHTARLLQLVGEKGTVVAVEPLAMARRPLELLAPREPRLRVIGAAVGDRAGEAPFFIAEQALEESGFGVRKIYASPTSFQEIRVPVQTLDHITADYPRSSYIKIDVEAAEAAVIRGGTKVLTSVRPIFSFEHGCEACDLLAQEGASMYQIFNNAGYRVFDVCLNRYSHDHVFQQMVRSSVVYDFLAVPEEKESAFARQMASLDLAHPVSERTYRYPASFESGMEFRIGFLPAFLESIEGLSSPEEWGCWTNDNRVVARFRDPLPARFRLLFEGYIFAALKGKPIRSVTDGETVSSCSIKGLPARSYEIRCTNKGESRSLEMLIPSPIAPADFCPGRSTDTRRLGVGLKQMYILPK